MPDRLATALMLLLLTGLLIPAPIAVAQPQGDEKITEPPAESTEDDADEKEPEKDRYFAIIGVRIHTVAGPTLENGSILCKNGKIVGVGPVIDIPEEATVLDATGYEVYPGLVAVRSSGILGGGRPDDSTNVYGLNMAVALAAGITTAVTGNDAAKLTFGSVEDIILKRKLYESISYSTRNPQARRKLRKDLDRVRQYQRDLAAYEEEKSQNPDAKKPDDKWIRGNYQKYLRLLKGEATALVDANRRNDLVEIADLAETYGIQFVVRGAIEGWTAAPQLARAGIAAIVTPRARLDPDDRTAQPNGSTIENAAILHEHGVLVAFIPVGGLFGPGYRISFGGLAGRDLLHLPMEAAFAVRGGMSNRDAVSALTLDAARILGIDDRVGSIEIGKDADFVITDGDLLHYMTHTRWTIVNGRIVYDKATETLFSHIRPEGDADAPPPDDYWPRRLGEAW